MQLSNDDLKKRINTLKQNLNLGSPIKAGFNYDNPNSKFKTNNYLDPYLSLFISNLEDLTTPSDFKEPDLYITHLWQNDFNYYIICDDRFDKYTGDPKFIDPVILINYKQRGNTQNLFHLESQQPVTNMI